MSFHNFTYVIRYKELSFDQLKPYSHKTDMQMSPEEIWGFAYEMQGSKGWSEVVEIEEIHHTRYNVVKVERSKIKPLSGPRVVVNKKHVKQRGCWDAFCDVVGEDTAILLKDDEDYSLSIAQAKEIGLL